MPIGPKGQKRPADVIGNAVHVMKIATGEITETLTEDGKNAAAVALGRLGGKARAKSISKSSVLRLLVGQPENAGRVNVGTRIRHLNDEHEPEESRPAG